MAHRPIQQQYRRSQDDQVAVPADDAAQRQVGDGARVQRRRALAAMAVTGVVGSTPQASARNAAAAANHATAAAARLVARASRPSASTRSATRPSGAAPCT